MREIKFRAWDTLCKEWVSENHCREWDYVELSMNGKISLTVDGDGGKDGIHEHSVSYKENRFILMQFTGLKDKTGKEVYESDIIVDPEKQGEDQVPQIVKWVNTPYTAAFDFGYAPSCKDFVVVGNIYENPELLG